MKTWATIDDHHATHPDEQVTDNQLRTATLAVNAMLYGATFNPATPATAEALRDATIAQAHATLAAETKTGPGAALTPDMLQQATINGTSYTLRDNPTTAVTAATLDPAGRSVEAWLILQQAGLLRFDPTLVG